MHKRRWILIGSLLAVTLLVDFGIVVLLDPREGPTAIEILRLALVCSQGSLLAVWAAFGGKPTPWRMVAAILVCAAYLWLSIPHSDMDPVAYVLLGQTIVGSVAFWGLRLAGVGVTRISADASACDPAAGGRRLQFSLRWLLEWTTGVAVLLGMLHYLPEDSPDEFFQPQVWIVFFAPGTVVAVVALWTALGTRWLGLRIAVAGVIVFTAAISLWLYISHADLWKFCFFFVSQALWMIGSLAVFRAAGYRVSLRWKRAREREEES